MVLRPMFGAEIERARAAALMAEALADRRQRRQRRQSRAQWPGGLRLAVGMRLVAMGFRLLGEGVEVR